MFAIVQFNENESAQEAQPRETALLQASSLSLEGGELGGASCGILTNYTVLNGGKDVRLFINLIVSAKPARTVAWVTLSKCPHSL